LLDSWHPAVACLKLIDVQPDAQTGTAELASEFLRSIRVFAGVAKK
jgi:hypothetical protein